MIRSLFSDTSENTVQMKEELSSPVQSTQEQVSAIEEKQEDREAAGNQPAEDNDSLDEGILDEGRQLTPIDNLASPEDSYFLGFEYTEMNRLTRWSCLPPPPPQTTGRRVHFCKASHRCQTSTPTNNTCYNGASCMAGKGKTRLPAEA